MFVLLIATFLHLHLLSSGKGSIAETTKFIFNTIFNKTDAVQGSLFLYLHTFFFFLEGVRLKALNLTGD